ncbi:MAG: 2OG-Fe(II) oxygenase, partial [Rudaea sp.]
MAVAIAKDNAPRLFDPARLDRADTQVRNEPFRFLFASGQLPADCTTALHEDFPKYAGAGFFPYDETD